MDVSFTNVLEGARQYFQGLPTATSSSSNTVYTTTSSSQSYGTNHGQSQTQNRPSPSAPYWPPHHESQIRPPSTREHNAVEGASQRPPSHPTDTPRSTPSTYNVQPMYQEPQQQQQQQQTGNYGFQFTRPQSREVPSSHANPQISQPYQSHILPNPSYHQTPSPQQIPSRVPSREQTTPTSLAAQTCHLPPQHTTQSYANYPQQRQHHQPIQQHNQPVQQPQQQQHVLHHHSPQQQMQQQHHTQQQHQSQTHHPQQQSQSHHPQQQAQTHHPQHVVQAQHQRPQQRPYYPQTQRSQHYNYQPSQTSYQNSSQGSFPTPSSQSYSQDSSYVHHSYASHSQSSLQTSTYSTPKSTATHTQDSNLKENHINNGATTQHQTPNSYKTTHNLPPIAALSVNYHSNRSSREALRLAVSKPKATGHAQPMPQSKPVAVNPAVPTEHTSRVNQQYQMQSNHPQVGQVIVSMQQSRTNPTQQYHYTSNTTAVQSNTNNNNNFPSAHIPPVQSSTTHGATHPHTESAKTYQIPVSKSVQQPNQNQVGNSSLTSVLKQKRESPLDLSVKTVRTSADSTLDVDSHSNEMQRLKYYQNMRPSQSPMQAPNSYPTYETYGSTFQKTNMPAKQTMNTGAPKVDFLPNFNVQSLNHIPATSKADTRRTMVQGYDNVNHMQQKSVYQQSVGYQPRHHVPTLAHSNNVSQAQRKTQQGLPRIDFPPSAQKTQATLYKVPELQRKRVAEPMIPVIPNKMPKEEMWRQAIDQQIEQKLSSYKSKTQDQKQGIHPKPLANGAYPPNPTSQERSKEMYAAAYQRSLYSPLQSSQTYPTNHYNHMQQQATHNQTYVPTAAAHQYPGYSNHGSQQALYSQHNMLPRTNSNPPSNVNNNRNGVGGAADKRVLNLLRNSLEIKSAKEAQKKMELEQMKSTGPAAHIRPDIQQPSTDVMAPLQPKPGVVGRHNISPFAATSLFERTSNTPPIYKLQFPKAMDSIKLDVEMAKELTRISDKAAKPVDINQTVLSNSSSDLDGLAAFLAARIRTKAELKQVGTAQNAYNNSVYAGIARQTPDHPSPQISVNNGAFPAKFKDKSGYPSRRRLFSRNEEEMHGSNVAKLLPRDRGLRSSSETSVFDFPDSDSEGEMPVLVRQSLVDMRRDRKVIKPVANELIEPDKPPSPFDNLFDDACDKFVEQLKTGIGKKRGRRKKVVEPEMLAKLETVTKERPLDSESKVIVSECVAQIKHEDLSDNKEESDTDSDVPLIKCRNKASTPTVPTANEAVIVDKKVELEEIPKIKVENADVPIKQEPVAASSSDSEAEPIKVLSEKLKGKRGRPRKKPLPTPTKTPPTATAPALANKPPFGDGSDFRPGWEEELFNYKRSLRIPTSLIHVTRPPQYHRLSTSLPDLDPCPNSPYICESTEFSKTSIKTEVIDSDVDSNSNISFSFCKNYDSEEGSSSVKSFGKIKPSNSILERLMERCGHRKRKRIKKKGEEGPKIIPKAENPVELLATPSLENVEDKTKRSPKKYQPIIKGEAMYFEFRKQTISDFKDAFINNSNKLLTIGEQFKTIVLKSRTRTETRVLKQKATIKEIFGEDRPASAPPVTCVDSTETLIPDAENSKSQMDLSFSKSNENTQLLDIKERYDLLRETKEVLKNKLLNHGQKDNLLKRLANRKLNLELPDDDSVDIKRDPDSKSETPSIDGDDYSTPIRRRMKNMRRKFSSGFDYIRKKKKQAKKENVETEPSTKPKRRGLPPRTSPESIQDIQKEVKTWVMNKGIGETHLHRASRLGYTDITAYCLEKMNCNPSPKDNAGYTPLHEACSRGHLDIARLLLMYGANVSESAQGGIRALHEAVENGFVEVVRLLLSYGADPLLATYSGLTPLSLATDEVTANLLKYYIADVHGEAAPPWYFNGPACCFDPEESGYNPLQEVPIADAGSEDDDIEFETSEMQLPNVYTFKGEQQPVERWILLQDLSNILKIKSRDALLKQVCDMSPSSSSCNYKNVLKEVKMTEFLENCRCSQYMCAGEKVNTRASKIALVKYSDKVKELLGVEKEVVTLR